MAEKDINACGLACPKPVVLTKQALEGGARQVRVTVDSENSRENVTRFARSRGCTVETAEAGTGVWTVSITAGEPAAGAAAQSEDAGPALSRGGVVYLFDSDFVGTNRDLGKVLTNGFLNASLSLSPPADAVVLISNGVRLATQGSYALEVLEKVAQAGTRVLICGTCVDFFKIRDKVQIGTISNALEILECLTGAEKLVKF